jgi:hypothetical protein
MQEEQKLSLRMLALSSGTIAGFLIAVSALVMLGHTSVALATMWRDLFVSSTAQVKSALAWWLIAGTALVGGFLAAAMTRFLIVNWWPLRLPRWILGTIMVAGLVAVGRFATEPNELDAATRVASSLSGMMAALVAAGVGAFFAARR